MSANTASTMSAARRAQADEFYTRREEIEAEMVHYRERFRGARVLLNADDPRHSQFWWYFADNFDDLGLERLTATYRRNDEPVYITTKDDDGVRKERAQGNGDFRSPEVVALLDEHDLVVTNPPFSLFREHITQLLDRGKDFVILGNMNAIVCREVFPAIASGRVGWGPSIRSGDRPFRVPADYPLAASRCWEDEDGTRWVRVKGVRWFTTLDHHGRHEPVPTTRRYSPEEYPAFDHFPAIEVSRVADIPSDYDGLMAVPITYLGRHDPEQFEIVDLLNRYAVLDSQGTNETVRAARSHSCNLGGKAVFSRLVIRRVRR